MWGGGVRLHGLGSLSLRSPQRGGGQTSWAGEPESEVTPEGGGGGQTSWAGEPESEVTPEGGGSDFNQDSWAGETHSIF